MNIVEREAWECGECHKVFVSKDIAEGCCEKKPCVDCGRATRRTYDVRCSGCQSLREFKSWEEADKSATDQPLVYSDFLSKYFPPDQMEEEYFEAIEDETIVNVRSSPLTLLNMCEDLRMYTCEPRTPSHFSLLERYEDYIAEIDGEDMEPPGDWEKAEQAVNDYFKECGPWSYWQTRTAWNGE